MIRFRGDIEGLRALAVLLVIFNHLGIPGFYGGFIGVDVFFVISGYLITSLLAAEYAEKAAARDGSGSISIGHFYLRRARRILPAALAVIAAVVIASHLLLNVLRVQQVRHDALWATFFAANINYIRQATDYFGAGLAASSPFRHYWSLSVEEQFYFVWPALFLLVVGLHGLMIRRRRFGWRLRLGIALTCIGVASLIWSITDTAANPVSAYFSTLTRAWELALGALIAIATTRATMIGYRWATAASLAGVGLLVAGCFAITGSSAFPGYLALLPTAGAGLLIVGGIADILPAPNRILSVAPMRFLGRISYSLYLWHWPLIVFAAALYPHASPMMATRAAIFALTIAIATVSFYAIERPFRRMSFTRAGPLVRRPMATAAHLFVPGSGFRKRFTTISAIVAIVGISVALGFAVAGQGETASANGSWVRVPVNTRHHRPTRAVKPPQRAHTPTRYEALLSSWQAKVKGAVTLSSVPANLQPLSSHLAVAAAPCNDYRLAIVAHEQECAWGNPNAHFVAAITGDSHAGMWLTTLEGALDAQTWSLHPFTRSWCGWSPSSGADPAHNRDCAALQAQTLTELKKLHVDLLIVTEDGVHSEQQMADALRKYARVAKVVVVLGHTPVVVPSFDNCLRGATDISHCRGYLSVDDVNKVALEQNVAAISGARFIDTTPWFCYDLTCPPIIDNAEAFPDGSHTSTEIAPKFAPLLQASLREVGALPPKR